MNSVMTAALQTDQVTIDPSLRLYIPFNENVGDVAKDYSQYGNIGKLTDVKWGIDSGVFNGTSAYVSCGDGSSLNVTDTITIEVWVKASPLGSGNQRIVTRYQVSVAYYTLCLDTNGYSDFRLKGATGESAIQGTSDLRDDTWHHIVGISDPTTSDGWKIYEDGVEVVSGDSSGIGSLSHSADVNVGRHVNGSEYFNGIIGMARIYDRTLSVLEVLSHYNGERATPGIPEGYFKLGQGKLGISSLG